MVPVFPVSEEVLRYLPAYLVLVAVFWEEVRVSQASVVVLVASQDLGDSALLGVATRNLLLPAALVALHGLAGSVG